MMPRADKGPIYIAGPEGIDVKDIEALRRIASEGLRPIPVS
jgi:hypothetical protein